MKQRRCVCYYHGPSAGDETDPSPHSTELFNKAYNHISERIDEVYKDLTKGKAAPMGGVAYLSLEDNEVRATAKVKSRRTHSSALFFFSPETVSL